jgi:hypothetical protein
MKKLYFFAIALMVSLTAGAQTTIDITAINSAYTTTVDGTLVLDVAKTASKLAAPLVSYTNPFYGLSFTEADITFDVYNYDAVHVLGALFTIYDPTLGRMYFTNGSYLGFNTGATSYFDANLISYGLGTDFIGSNTWATVRLQFTNTGFAMYVNNTLAYDQNSTDVTIAGPLTDYSNVISFLQNASTLMFGTGSWWSDNTKTDGTYYDFQSSYLKNITFSTTTTALNLTKIDPNSELVSQEFLTITGAKAGSDYNQLRTGIYIKKALYSNGVTKNTKILKVEAE